MDLQSLVWSGSVCVKYEYNGASVEQHVGRQSFLDPYDALGLLMDDQVSMWCDGVWMNWRYPCGVNVDIWSLKTGKEIKNALIIKVVQQSYDKDLTAQYVIPCDGMSKPFDDWTKAAYHIMEKSIVGMYSAGSEEIEKKKRAAKESAKTVFDHVDTPEVAMQKLPIAIHVIYVNVKKPKVQTMYHEADPDGTIDLEQFLYDKIPSLKSPMLSTLAKMEGRVLVQGIVPSPESTLSWLYENMKHPHHFLHITVKLE
eukprot:TRINITY_DN9018_c1_g3_i1.p1 TRINITY_DN9018_c1_g3~~TRINITY_DN9018_c1_g3_i1.p1  ORF type:complete len:255 (+),score=50.90 TRINITY_DN9018_c1_g3_i1:43-807(+)